MRKIYFLSILIVLASCSPKITTNVIKQYEALGFKDSVKVLALNDDIPSASETIGTIQIGNNNGFSSLKPYDELLDKLTLESRKYGANAIKLLDYNILSSGKSTYISARMLKVIDFNSKPIYSKSDSAMMDADYAELNIYRFNNGMGAFIGYDLYLGDTLICRVKNNAKQTIKIKKFGQNTLWAKTEAKVEFPINIKKGKEYFIRCSVVPGIMVGRPHFEMTSKEEGRKEFKNMCSNCSTYGDKIILNDGRIYQCHIDNENSESIYFTMYNKGSKVSTHLSKTDVKEVIKEE